MLDFNKTKRSFTVTAGILIFCVIGAHSRVIDTAGYDLKANFMDKHWGVTEVFSNYKECTSPHTMSALLGELSTLSVQLTIHEERDGVIISDPIQGLVDELELVYARDLCTDFVALSQEQQILYIEIESLLYELKGLGIKAMHIEGGSTPRIYKVL